MISLINKEWLNQEFPETDIHSIDSVIRIQNRQFSLKAATNTNISIIGASLFNFGIPDNQVRLKVPFIITNQPLEDSIIAYNIIEHIETNLPFTESEPILKSTLPRFAPKKTELLTNLTKTNQDNPDFIGDVKKFKKIVMSPKTIRDVWANV